MSRSIANGSYPKVLDYDTNSNSGYGPKPTDVYNMTGSTPRDQEMRFNVMADNILTQQRALESNNVAGMDRQMAYLTEQPTIDRPSLPALNTTAGNSPINPIVVQQATPVTDKESFMPLMMPVSQTGRAESQGGQPLFKNGQEKIIVIVVVIAAVVFLLFQIWSSQRKIELMLMRYNGYSSGYSSGYNSGYGKYPQRIVQRVVERPVQHEVEPVQQAPMVSTDAVDNNGFMF